MSNLLARSPPSASAPLSGGSSSLRSESSLTASGFDFDSESWFRRDIQGRRHSLVLAEKYPYSRTSPWVSSDVYYGDASSSTSSWKVSLPSYNPDAGLYSGRSTRRRWRLGWNLNSRSWFGRGRSASASGSLSPPSLSSSSSVKGRYSKGWSAYHVSWWSDTPLWKYLRITFISVLLTWSIYCTIRYFMSLTVFVLYDNDPLRSHVAISLGTLSTLSTIFFALETTMVYALAMHLHISERFRTYVHFLTYFASFLAIVPAVVNVGVVVAWRRPKSVQDFGRVIRGRCGWDVDAVWTGTGMECFGADEVPFGVWIGAGVARLLGTLVVVCLYFVVARYFPRPEEEPVPLPLEAGSQMDELTTDVFSSPKDPRHLIYNQPGSLSSEQILRHVKAMSGGGSGSGSDDDEDRDDDEYSLDLGDLHADTKSSHYARVLTDEPDHIPLSLSLSQLTLAPSLDRSSSRGPGLVGPRPKPKPKPSLRSISSISGASTISSTSTVGTTSGRSTPTQTHSEELSSQSLSKRVGRDSP